MNIVVVRTTDRNFNDRWGEMLRALPASRRPTSTAAPVFWIRGTPRYQTGYNGPTSLLGWIGGVIKGFFSLLFGHGGGSVDPPPGGPQYPGPGNGDGSVNEPDLGEVGPVPVPPNELPIPPMETAVDEVDWSDVNVVALASTSVPKITRMLVGPAQRALNDVSKGRATLNIVAQRTHPKRFDTIQDAASVDVDVVYIFVLVDKQDSGLVKGIITKKIETQVLDKLGGLPAPFELIFRRTNRTLYDRIVSALETHEDPPVDPLSEAGLIDTPEKQPLWAKLLHNRLETSDNKAANLLKTVIDLKSVVGKVSDKIHEPVESPQRYARQDIDELTKAIRTEPAWAKTLNTSIETRIEKSDSKALVILKQLGFIKMAQDKVVGKVLDVVPDYDLSEKGFPFKKATLFSVLSIGLGQLVMGRRRRKSKTGAVEVASDVDFQTKKQSLKTVSV